jgi:hypothetical protein
MATTRTISVLLVVACVFLGACGSGAESLAFYAATKPDGQAETQDGGSCNWEKTTFTTFAGVQFPIFRTSKPQWTLDFGKIQSVTVYDAIPSPGIPEPREYVVAELTVTAEAGRAFAKALSSACGDLVVVRYRERDLYFGPEAQRNAVVLPGGAFSDRREAHAFYQSISERVVDVNRSSEESQYWLQRNRDLVDRVVWYAKCDPEYVQGLGDGLYEAILALPDIEERMKNVDCKAPPVWTY